VRGGRDGGTGPAKASPPNPHLGNATRCAPLHNVRDLPGVGQVPQNFPRPQNASLECPSCGVEPLNARQPLCCHSRESGIQQPQALRSTGSPAFAGDDAAVIWTPGQFGITQGANPAHYGKSLGGCGAFSTGSGMCSRILRERTVKRRRRHSGNFAAAFFACSARMAASSASTFFRSSSVNTVAERGGGMSWTAG
jgi:hypothetical protein